jgi:hypothetical protein
MLQSNQDDRLEILVDNTPFTLEQLEKMDDDTLSALWDMLLELKPEIAGNATLRANVTRQAARHGAKTETLPMPAAYE